MGVFPFLAVVLASFISVAAKAFQQLNVVHDYKRLVPVVSVVMAACEVGLGGNIAIRAVEADLWGLGFTVVAMAGGASAGAITSMVLHKRMRKNGNG
jgi:hypothetical protein